MYLRRPIKLKICLIAGRLVLSLGARSRNTPNTAPWKLQIHNTLRRSRTHLS